MTRLALLLFFAMSVPASAEETQIEDQLAAVHACLMKRLADADASAVAAPRLVAIAMRDCQVAVASYLKTVEVQKVSMTRGWRAPAPGGPSATPTPTPKARRAAARQALVDRYVEQIEDARKARKGK